MTIEAVKIHRAALVEYEPHRFAAEASGAGLRPGQWPRLVSVEIGNGQPFRMRHMERRDGDLAWVDYDQDLGCVSIRLYND